MRHSGPSDDATECAQAATMAKSRRNRIKHDRIPAEDFRAILHANSRFYGAFSSLDMAAMENAWLDNEKCVCHFPGMKRLVGYKKIMQSFQHAVNEMDSAVKRNWMEPKEIQIEFQTSEKATVFCQEFVYVISCSVVAGELRPESQLIRTLSATNAFKKVNGKWYLWYHQASMMGSGKDNVLYIQKLPTDSLPDTRHEPPTCEPPTADTREPPTPVTTTEAHAPTVSAVTLSQTFVSETAVITVESDGVGQDPLTRFGCAQHAC